jgi:hypothetical protein
MLALQPGATSAATRIDCVGASPLHVKVSRRESPFGGGVSRIRKEVVPDVAASCAIARGNRVNFHPPLVSRLAACRSLLLQKGRKRAMLNEPLENSWHIIRTDALSV